jgi:hypothetical protein
MLQTLQSDSFTLDGRRCAPLQSLEVGPPDPPPPRRRRAHRVVRSCMRRGRRDSAGQRAGSESAHREHGGASLTGLPAIGHSSQEACSLPASWCCGYCTAGMSRLVHLKSRLLRLRNSSKFSCALLWPRCTATGLLRHNKGASASAPSHKCARTSFPARP